MEAKSGKLQYSKKKIANIESDISTILTSLLQSAKKDDKDVADAVENINKLYHTFDGEVYDGMAHHTEPETCDVETFFFILWNSILSIVQKIPYNHPDQRLLYHFVTRLHRRGSGTVTVGTIGQGKKVT